ncbi:hypothetical protein KJ742_05035 [Patescibacteria group bacterium]|nr:hypothetical protein [Patescibacteria group bacterium]
MKTCKQCNNSFEVTDQDRDFYERVSPEIGGKKFPIPEPTLCPPCRSQRRMSFRNERSLYHRKCDLTGKQMVTMFAPESPYTVYDQEEWWSDKWDPIDYGQDFDFSRPFFEQFKELQLKVPRMSLSVINSENSAYTNIALGNKDSYLIYTADYNEKCAYGRTALRNFNCFDFDFMDDCKFCYECTDVYKSHECFYCQKVENSSGLAYCYNMQSSKNCMFCINLTNAEYCIFNEKVSKEEFEQKRKEIFSSYAVFQAAKKKAQELFLKFPRKFLENLNCENCLGNYLKDSRNSEYCFDSNDLEDCKYCSYIGGGGLKDCYDWDFFGGKSELCYEMVSSAYQLNKCAFCMNSWETHSDLYYCDLMLGDQNCFGCISLRKKKYCILNKQYTKEQYEELVPKIIEHMKRTGEWGEFFPMECSPFAYNETIANLHYPMTEEEVKKKGWRWQKDIEIISYKGPVYEIPDRIEDTQDDICKAILVCEVTGKNYKIIPQELNFYKQFNLPIPRRCPDQRHLDRMALRNPRNLWDRKCDKCSADIKTTYSPDRSEKVYCEQCYLELVY